MEYFDKIRTMPVQRQILLVLGILVIVVFMLGSAYFVFLRQPEAVLFSNLRTMDAATIVAELDKRKVPYHLTEGGTTILVAQDKVDATRLNILSQDLPLKGAVGFELFNKSDIGLTEFAQKINYQRALQGELARTIMAIDSVDMARVHLSLPEPTIFRDDKRPAKASIALTLKPGKVLAPTAVLGIQRLAAAAVPDLDVANVVVVDGEGQVISADRLPEVVTESTTTESPAQHAAETYYADKVRQTLSTTYPGQAFTVKAKATAVSFVAPSEEGDQVMAPSADPFAQWTPEQRAFRLTVEVTSPAARDAESQQNIRVAAAAAIGANPALGDEISVTPGDLAEAPPPGYAAPAAAPTATRSEVGLVKSDSKFPWLTFWMATMIVAAAVITLAVSQMLRAGRAPRRLTDAERREFANRFQALLDQGEADATKRP